MMNGKKSWIHLNIDGIQVLNVILELDYFYFTSNIIDSNDHYLFNPWTGETILSNISNLALLDRSKSMWAKPEKFPSINAKTTQVRYFGYLQSCQCMI